MGKIITILLLGGVIAGGAYYYSQSQKESVNQVVYTFTDPNPQRLPGCAREVTFSATGCTAIDSNCNDYEGSATTQTVQQECGTSGNGGAITDEQFECAMDLCTPGISVPVGTESIKAER